MHDNKRTVFGVIKDTYLNDQTWFYEDNKKAEIGKIGSIEYTIKKESQR